MGLGPCRVLTFAGLGGAIVVAAGAAIDGAGAVFCVGPFLRLGGAAVVEGPAVLGAAAAATAAFAFAAAPPG